MPIDHRDDGQVHRKGETEQKVRLIVKKNVFLPSDGEECPEESVNTGKRPGEDVVDSVNSGNISIVAQSAHQGIRLAHYGSKVQLSPSGCSLSLSLRLGALRTHDGFTGEDSFINVLCA